MLAREELRGDLQRLRFEATGLSEPLVPEAGALLP